MATRAEPYAIFNDKFSKSANYATAFWSFPRLPAELRSKIWADCLPENRFIHIHLNNEPGEDFHPLYTTRNGLGNIISGCAYRLRLPTAKSEAWLPNSLMGVNREANSIFRSVYRVRLPVPNSGRALYICPESDVVWAVCHQNSPANPLLVALLHDMVAYDPRGVGVAHLAIGGTTLNDSSRLAELDPDQLPPPARRSMTQLLSSSLQTFFPVVSPGWEGRLMLGVMSWRQGQFHHNRSVPILPGTQSFVCLKRDPRPILADLEQIAVGTDPRRIVFLWNRLKANFAIDRHIKISYILTIMPDMTSDVFSRSDFTHRLERDDNRWAEWASLLSQNVWGDRMSQEEYETQRTSLPQAAGLWTFPEEAFGEIPDIQEMDGVDTYWEVKMVKDLSEFHPEVWVFDLP